MWKKRKELGEGSPRGLGAIGVFWVFGALMAWLAGVTLVWPGTVLDRAWVLNPRAYGELAPLGKAVGVLFLLLGGALAVTALGWFQRRIWGWRLGVVLVATQVLGNVFSLFRGRVVEGVVGVTIAGALLFYLLRAKVRTAFEGDGTRTV